MEHRELNHVALHVEDVAKSIVSKVLKTFTGGASCVAGECAASRLRRRRVWELALRGVDFTRLS